MKIDLENATKAAHTAALLVMDLRSMLKSGNPLVAELAMHELGEVAETVVRLERLRLAIEQHSVDKPSIPEYVFDALQAAERFITGFEDEKTQQLCVSELLLQIRNAMDGVTA